MHHVIVDNLRADPWAVVAAIAALIAAAFGIGAFIIAWREFKLTESQLAETQRATEQTQESLKLGQQQLEYLQRADLDRLRSLAPRVTAEMKWVERMRSFVMHLYNGGALAQYVFVTGQDPQGRPRRIEIQRLDAHEERMEPEFSGFEHQRVAKDVRIRAQDVLGNKYITEYRSLSNTLAYPIFRTPWLGQGIEPRPKRCSAEVSWPVEGIERTPGSEPERVEEGFNPDAPV